MKPKFILISLVTLLTVTAFVFQSCKKKDDNTETIPETPPEDTIGVFTDSRDGQVYNWVQIGGQTWFVENLNYESGSSWCYDNNSTNCITYGRLYDWATIMNGESSSGDVPSGVQGICPVGWHLPSDEEWKILEGNADTQYGVGHTEWDGQGYHGYDAGKRLKTTSGWNENTGTDAVGFSALPGGFYDTKNGNFINLGIGGYWWSATEPISTKAWFYSMYDDFNGVNRGYEDWERGYSVRCLKD